MFNKIRSYHLIIALPGLAENRFRSPNLEAKLGPDVCQSLPNDHMIVLDWYAYQGVSSRNGDVVWCGMFDSYLWILVLVWYLNLDILNGHSLVRALFFRRSPENYLRTHSEHVPNPVFSDAREFWVCIPLHLIGSEIQNEAITAGCALAKVGAFGLQLPVPVRWGDSLVRCWNEFVKKHGVQYI